MSRMTDQIGRVLSGRYRLIAPVGTGASAQVFLADDVRLRRRVAVKVLHAALADDDAFLRRFRAEAQAAAALNHPNIVAVYDWGDDDGAPVHRHGVPRRRQPPCRARPGRSVEPVTGAPGGPRGHTGARLRPSARVRAPRRQAGQPALRRRRPPAGGRLRPGPGAGRGGLDRAAGRRARDRALRLPGAGAGAAGRRQGRRVLPRPRPHRGGHRCRALLGRHHHRHPDGPGGQARRGTRRAGTAAEAARSGRLAGCGGPTGRRRAGRRPHGLCRRPLAPGTPPARHGRADRRPHHRHRARS